MRDFTGVPALRLSEVRHLFEQVYYVDFVLGHGSDVSVSKVEGLMGTIIRELSPPTISASGFASAFGYQFVGSMVLASPQVHGPHRSGALTTFPSLSTPQTVGTCPQFSHFTS